MRPESHDIVLLSTADWDNPFWTNKQHVAKEFEKLGYNVLYIESVGIRMPSAKNQDLRRIFKRMIRGLKPPRRVSTSIYVWSPLSIPLRRFKIINLFNHLFFNFLYTLYKWFILSKGKKKVLWTYLPITKQYLQPNKFDISVYHCVDDISAQPRMPVELINSQEKLLSEEVDYIFTTAPALQEKCNIWNEKTYFFPNVADHNHFSKALSDSCTIPDDIKKIDGPIVGFIGAISSYKLDFDLICSVAKHLPQFSFVFIGKIGEGDPMTTVNELYKIDNIHFLGPKDYTELPNYLKGIDIALLPNNINQYTTSMFPMKFFEYLAAGKPVVSVDLPAIKDHQDYYYCSTNSKDFAQNIELAYSQKDKTNSINTNYAKSFDYTSRMKKMLDLIN